MLPGGRTHWVDVRIGRGINEIGESTCSLLATRTVQTYRSAPRYARTNTVVFPKVVHDLGKKLAYLGGLWRRGCRIRTHSNRKKIMCLGRDIGRVRSRA